MSDNKIVKSEFVDEVAQQERTLAKAMDGIAEDPKLARYLSADSFRGGTPGEQLLATIRGMIDGAQDNAADSLSYSALLSVMGADLVKYVRDDDGVLWPFVPGDEFWRGPLRLTDDKKVEMARFYPDEEKIVWRSPWDT